MFRKISFLMIIAALILSACSSIAPMGGSIKLTDGLGREVSLAAPAQRVVSLAASNTEILFAVGAGSQVVGRDEFSDYPAEAQAIASVGGSMGEYSLEAIAALKPDLVIAAEINAPELVKSIEDLGITVYYLKNPATLEEMYTNLEVVAQLTGHESESAALIESLKARVKKVDDAIMPLSYAPAVFYELDSTDPAKPFTAGPGTFVDLLIARAGGINVGSSLEGSWAQIGLEQLLVSNPQIIILGDAAWGTTVESVAQRPGWESLDAVKNNAIFPFDANLVSRPGPRLVDGLEALVEILHPGVLK
jgi:iron complex transport system substrate-binding protein